MTLDTVEAREEIDKMVQKLFELLGVSPADQNILLASDDDQEVRERERLLLLIHKSLRILFPYTHLPHKEPQRGYHKNRNY